MIDCGCESYLRCEQMLFFGFQGGDQSPEGSAGRAPRGSPEAAALGSVRSCRSCHAACQHVFLHHYLFFLLPVPPLRIPPGLPWWRGGPQRCPVVAAGDQPTVNGGHSSGGGGGSLEESLSGNDWEKMTSLFTLVILCKCGETMTETAKQWTAPSFLHRQRKDPEGDHTFFPRSVLDVFRGRSWKWRPGWNSQTSKDYKGDLASIFRKRWFIWDWE